MYVKTLCVTSDIVLKEMYQVIASGSDHEKETHVLRPEGKAGVLRSILADHKCMKYINRQTDKTWYWGPMFRRERPDAERLIQF